MTKEAFNVAVSTKKITSSKELASAVLKARPDLEGQEVRYPSPGCKAYIVIIGNEVFKSPVNGKPYGEDPMDDFRTERDTLKALENSGLAVPKLTTLNEEPLFLGMTLIEGQTLSHNFESTMTKEQQQQLATDLITFVMDLAHALPMKGNEFAAHGDLWHSNIMIDPKTNRLAGVIDFGKIDYQKADKWHPMYDFNGSNFYNLLQAEFDARKSELPGKHAAAETPKFGGLHNLKKALL